MRLGRKGDDAVSAFEHMRRLIPKLLVLTGIFVCLLAVVSVTAQAEDALSHSIEISPKALTGPGTINVAINIVNTSDGSPVSVTLLDPGGNVCSSFGSGGTATLQAGGSASYTGNWTVTEAQLKDGRVTYSARYSVANTEGQTVQANKPISASITYNTAKAQLNIERNVEPGQTVVQGQTVKIRYVIRNTGTLDVTDITIKDPDIISEPAVRASLAVGETAELSYSYVAGSASKTTHAEISYKYELDGKTQTSKTIKADPAVTIEVTVPDLVVQLNAQQIVNAGDKVDLKYVITNSSELSYEQVKITDAVLGDIDQGLSLGAGKSIEGEKSITITETGTYQFTVTAVDSTEQSVTYQSNQLTIQTTDAVDPSLLSGPATLEIVVEGDRDVIYEEPSPIVFRIKVTNMGSDTAENVTITAATRNTDNEPVAGKTIKTIDSIASGETVEFTKEMEASMRGQFQFTAAQSGASSEQTAISNAFPVEYHYIAPIVTPEPEPDPTEAPYVDPNATPESDVPFQPPEEEGGGLGSILLYVLAGLFGVIIVAVGVLFFLDSRRGGRGKGKGQIKVIDSIERTPHRDYTKAPKKGNDGRVKRDVVVESAPDDDPVSVASAYVPPGDRDDYDIEDYGEPFDELPETTDQQKSGPSMDDDAYDVSSIYRRPEMPSGGRSARDADDLMPVDDIPDLPEPSREPATAERTTRERGTSETPELSAAERQRNWSAGFAEDRTSERVANERVTTERATEAERPLRERPARERMIPKRSGTGASQPVLDDDIDGEPDVPISRGSSRQSLADEEAALLSGSTGQYRLSRKAASVWDREEPRKGSRSQSSDDERPSTRDRRRPQPAAEDPEDYARRQRAARSRKAGLNDYNDDDDPGTRRRTR